MSIVLIQRLVAEHLERRNVLSAHGSVLRKEVRFPLIAKEETGVISPVTGMDIDEMFGSDGLNPIHKRSRKCRPLCRSGCASQAVRLLK